MLSPFIWQKLQSTSKGYSMSELEKKIIADLIHVDDRATLMKIYKLIEDKLNDSKEVEIRRNTLANESRLVENNTIQHYQALKAEYEPDFDKNEIDYLFLDKSHKANKTFKDNISQVSRYDTTVVVLDKAVLVNDFLSMQACSSLMNAFLQVGSSQVQEGNILDRMSELINVWGGQALSFKLSKSNVMLPEESDTPSEIAFYKLEKKHIVFKTLAEELAVFFKSFYTADSLNVSLSLRYLVENEGGNPIHIDAWEDSLLKDGYIYTNQQFSLFLSAPESEEFIVFEEDGSKTVQSGSGSLLGFNPTLKHHHPDGNGSWILIIEVILKTKVGSN